MLLEVAAKYPSFPIVLEAVRECLQDVYDLPALVALMRGIDRREVQVADVATHQPSPFARSLLFGYVAQFMYEGDSPIAERRAAALSLDQGLLAELLGRAELRELLDPEVLAEVEAELQRTAPDRRVRDAEGVADLLRLLGPLSTAEIAERSVAGADVAGVAAGLADQRRDRRGADGRRRSAGPRSRTSAGSATASVSRSPHGTPDAFTEPVEDPLGDLVARYARTHGPFTVRRRRRPARRWAPPSSGTRSSGSARRAGCSTASSGPPAAGPSGATPRSCADCADARWPGCARRSSRSRPTPWAGSCPAWQHVGGRHRGIDGVLTVVDQLAGCAVPASALEPLVLAARVRDYEPAYLDELTASGEVVWAGHAALPGLRRLGLAPPGRPGAAHAARAGRRSSTSELHQQVLDALAPGGAFFFRQLADQVGSTDDAALSAALWDLVWAGRIGNDTLAPLRALIRSGTPAHRSRRPPPRLGRRPGSGPIRTGPPGTAGRWALLPAIDTDPTRRAHATAERLLDRHGVVTRGAVTSERVPGGFAAVYKVLAAFEESGRCRRGYFVDGLGAAQFGTAGSVDRLRTFAEVPPGAKPTAVALAATDPANPYGAALPWPESHRPPAGPQGRRGGRARRRRAHDVRRARRAHPAHLVRRRRPADPAAAALAEAARRGTLGRMTVEKADGEQLLGSGSTPLREALQAAGFVATPKGLRLRTTGA